MDFISGIWGYVILAIGAVAGVLGLMAKSKRSGKKEAAAEHAQERARTQEAETAHQATTIRETNDAKADVSNLPIGDAERELRDSWTRRDNENR